MSRAIAIAVVRGIGTVHAAPLPDGEPGLVIAIEPMVTEGHYAVETLEDGWTVVTKDRKNASHYEDTIVFIENGFMNLTSDEVL